MTFDELPLPERVIERLFELDFTQPTPIQEQAIPPALEGRDVLGKAETGTGKTLAFTLPAIRKLDLERVSVQVLVLCPTRELARQVAGTFELFADAIGFSVATIVGGEPLAEQVMALTRGCQVVVGTPGRVLDLASQRILTLGWVEVAILDEADRMLDMGFSEDVGKILGLTLPERQTLLFSATFPRELKRMADRHMKDRVEIETARGLATVKAIAQTYVKVASHDKQKLLRHILDISEDVSSIVFLNRKRDADRIGRDLWNRGYRAATLHGDYPQEVRDRVLGKFRREEIRVLVATDVAQRGLDIDGVASVINFNVPKDPEDYVHRIGRTGRAGRSGVVMTLVDETERQEFDRIRKRTGWELREMALPGSCDGWDKARERPRRGRRDSGRRHSGRGRRNSRGRGRQRA